MMARHLMQFTLFISFLCRTATQENDSAGFTGRLRALVNAFHVSSQAHFVEEFAAGANTILLSVISLQSSFSAIQALLEVITVLKISLKSKCY